MPSASRDFAACSASSSRIARTSARPVSEKPPHEAARRFVPGSRRRVSVGAEHAGARRHDHRPAPEDARQRVGVHRARATERHQRKVAGIEALLHGNETQRADHGLVDDVVDAGSGPLRRETERAARPCRLRPPTLPCRSRGRRRAARLRASGRARHSRRSRSAPCRPCRSRPGRDRRRRSPAPREALWSARARGRWSRRPHRRSARRPTMRAR